MSQAKLEKKVVILGAGVIGLTTAIVLLENEFQVTVVAEHLPGNLHPYYTSPWAGAHWRSYADKNDHVGLENDRFTFFKFMELCEQEDKSLIKLCKSLEYWSKKPLDYEGPWFKDITPNFREIDVKDLPKSVEFGIQYDAMCINAPKYLLWLKEKFTALGGAMIEKRVGHFNECFALGKANVVINCSGLGALTLGGLEDQAVFPTRGQTILIEAPHIDYSLTKHLNDEIVYLIPRGDGTVVLGGTREANSKISNPDPATAQTILERCQEVTGGLGEFRIIQHNVGFRPTREGGMRLSLEKLQINENVYYICHHYGHGGFGFQSSWGSANNVLHKIKSLFL
ncbi:hypothetical protein DSO57_1015646 [Entomophthora muscae]|uniref:Uncharacterized protein n=1 Tax=Entomophthora muscae TaxID=34485 RepID=A0ACC2SU72_9FUNG|nr:hypothetical protein DSO57_1015646 [Entomophthora muscae]